MDEVRCKSLLPIAIGIVVNRKILVPKNSWWLLVKKIETLGLLIISPRWGLMYFAHVSIPRVETCG